MPKFVLAFLCMLGATFFWIGGTGMWDLFGKIKEGYDAKTWPHTIGTVLMVSKKETDAESESHQVFVRYAYQVNGREYEGTTIHPAYKSSSFKSSHEQIENVLKAAQQVRVYYRPDNPAVSTLSFGFQAATLGLLITEK